MLTRLDTRALRRRAAGHAERVAPFDPDAGRCGPLLARVLDCDLAQAPTRGVERAGDLIAFEEVRRLLAAVPFARLSTLHPELPGVDAWLLREGGCAVCAAVTTADPDLVGVWALATPPALQRHGRGTLLLRAVLGHYALEGAEAAFLAAPPGTVPLPRALGFAGVRGSGA